jgi:hypothetical protein
MSTGASACGGSCFFCRDIILNKTYPLEEDEQAAVCNWLDAKNINYFAVPNVTNLVGFIKSKLAKIRFWQKRKKEGVKKGVQDLVIFLDDKILLLEMKRHKKANPSISKEQKKWNEIGNSYPYSEARIAYGAEMAIDMIKQLIED